MTKRLAGLVTGVSVVLAILALVGCDLADSDEAGELTGTWTISQVTLNGSTVPVVALGSGTLTLNTDGTFVASGHRAGGDTRSYSGTYTTNGNTIAFSVPGAVVPAGVDVILPVTAAVEFDADSLDIQLSRPVSARGYTVSAVFFTR